MRRAGTAVRRRAAPCYAVRRRARRVATRRAVWRAVWHVTRAPPCTGWAGRRRRRILGLIGVIAATRCGSGRPQYGRLEN
eukprot:gene10114-biopygen2877